MADEYKDLTDELASKNAIFAMMANNCYHDPEKPRYQLEEIGWQLTDRQGQRTSGPTKQSKLTGFAYDIYEDQNSNKAVIAFRGTDSKKDWIVSNLAVPFSIPYKSAVKAVREYLGKNSHRNLMLVGHSLGGGLALGASVHQGVPAITFDPTPRIFDGLGDNHLPAYRVVIFQEGEFLAKFRENLIKKAYSVVKKEDTYKCHYDFSGENAHRIDMLSRRIVEQGAIVNATLRQFL